MAITHLLNSYVAIEKISGVDHGQDGQSFIQLIEQKMNSALGEAPGDNGDFAIHTFRKKALFLFSIQKPAAEWYENNNITNATTWDNVQMSFNTKF